MIRNATRRTRKERTTRWISSSSSSSRRHSHNHSRSRSHGRLHDILLIVVVATIIGSCHLIPIAEANEHKNLFGNSLKPCSTPGMAVTGKSGSGYCDHIGNFDDFAHTVCIDLESFGGSDFFEVTGQPDWSDKNTSAGAIGHSLPCVQEAESFQTRKQNKKLAVIQTNETEAIATQAASCPIVHWCISGHDFASYMETMGIGNDNDDDSSGCDSLGHIVCESTNTKVVADYEEAIAMGNTKGQKALECLKLKCWF